MLINPRLANKEVASAYGTLKFNDKGESSDLAPEHEKIIGKLKGFTFKAEKAHKAADKEVKEDTKAKAPKKSNRAKKSKEAPVEVPKEK